MVHISPELESEIRRRAAEWDNMPLEAFLREALGALDRERAFEAAVLEGMDGVEEPVTPEDIEAIRQEGLARLRDLRGR